MAAAPRKRSFNVLLIALAGAAVLLLFLAPAAAASGAGRLLGELWLTTMGAVMGLLGGALS